jgi:hypothetical protein
MATMTDQPALLPDMPAPVAVRPRRHAEMIRLYGESPGCQCAQCRHLIRKRGDHAGHFLKCEFAGVTASAATDWRAKWPACGRFEER